MWLFLTHPCRRCMVMYPACAVRKKARKKNLLLSLTGKWLCMVRSWMSTRGPPPKQTLATVSAGYTPSRRALNSRKASGEHSNVCVREQKYNSKIEPHFFLICNVNFNFCHDMVAELNWFSDDQFSWEKFRCRFCHCYEAKINVYVASLGFHTSHWWIGCAFVTAPSLKVCFDPITQKLYEYLSS